MSTVAVDCRPARSGWACAVEVDDPRGRTSHSVEVSSVDLDRLAPGATDPADLVRRSFEFLLEREPPGSILLAFDLTVIGRYFPEYETEIRG